MFFEYKRDLPRVDRKVFDSLGPRDLVRAKQVCKSWAFSVRRYIRQVDANRASDLMKRAFNVQHSFQVVVEIPQTYRDLTINDRGEIYILGVGKIMQLDTVNFQVTKTMIMERNICSDVPEEEYLYLYEEYLKLGKHYCLFANKAGSQFMVKNPFGVVQSWRYMRSTGHLVQSGNSKTRMKYNSDAVGTKIVTQKKNISKSDLLKFKRCLNAYDIVQLGGGLFMHTNENLWDNSCALISVTSISNPVDGAFSKNIANVQMDPKNLKLRVVGTKVLCYERCNLFPKTPENESENDVPSSKIIVFDIWNPASVESEGMCSKIMYREPFSLAKFHSRTEMKQFIGKLS